ncbi:MAG: DUF952 domain-containing protein [Pseudomonadota bacterium]
MIYKVLTAEQWQTLKRDGESQGAPIDVADGFIHFSTGEQLAETLTRHFAGQDKLVLAAVAPEPLGAALKWEPSRGGALFPHLYAPLRLSDIAWTQEIAWQDGAHVLLGGLA